MKQCGNVVAMLSIPLHPWIRFNELLSVGSVVICLNFQKFLALELNSIIFQGVILCCLFYLSTHTLIYSQTSYCSCQESSKDDVLLPPHKSYEIFFGKFFSAF